VRKTSANAVVHSSTHPSRHAVGGEYGAGWKTVGAGKLVTTFFPDDDR